ncbi:hypothetical protein A464_1315 [Salmonella bongori N268-08]|uniref:Uncharacterized protein n=1 Tax=Salmonella bongori N268-08 TaxID=1197719 RepID=S5MP81_SALBN|nr:hypothetical protein A464_1315 [Salmonella bongori N268-08]
MGMVAKPQVNSAEKDVTDVDDGAEKVTAGDILAGDPVTRSPPCQPHTGQNDHITPEVRHHRSGSARH